MDSPTSPTDTEPAKKHAPELKSIRDLTIVESYDPGAEKPKYVTFFLLDDDKDLWFGESLKGKREISLEEYQNSLELVRDEELYPTIPEHISPTVAPDHLDDTNAFVKTPGLYSYESYKGTDFIPRSILEETLVMEQLSRSPHPNIIHYHGCRVKRGRIMAIVLERLEHSLTQYAQTPGYEQLNNANFFTALESAVQHIHAMGLAHNDINPDNIMVKDGRPVLIDFGSCQPFGKRLQSLGTVGWFEKEFFTSEREHDVFSMKKLREWLGVEKL